MLKRLILLSLLQTEIRKIIPVYRGVNMAFKLENVVPWGRNRNNKLLIIRK